LRLDIEIVDFRAIHGETIVMLAGNHDVLHARVFSQLRYFFGIEL
tara:strand:- start:52 stop:186 length:135 start_codon:yes stop_codon:yes gene_type:complete